MHSTCRGVKQDAVQARQWWEKAASQGDAGAQGLLGYLHYVGAGVIRNREKGCALWKLSAEQNDSYAMEEYKRNCPD